MDDAAQSFSPAAYKVLARKYRPQDFTGLIGQEALVRTLTNAIAQGRLAISFCEGVANAAMIAAAQVLCAMPIAH